MNINEIQEKLQLEWVVKFDCDITKGYASDLLSVVMAKCPENAIWLTVQGHKNVIAVCKMTDAKAVVVCEGSPVDEDTVAAAQKEEVCILRSEKGIFELAGKLYEMGIR